MQHKQFKYLWSKLTIIMEFYLYLKIVPKYFTVTFQCLVFTENQEKSIKYSIRIFLVYKQPLPQLELAQSICGLTLLGLATFFSARSTLVKTKIVLFPWGSIWLTKSVTMLRSASTDPSETIQTRTWQSQSGFYKRPQATSLCLHYSKAVSLNTSLLWKDILANKKFYDAYDEIIQNTPNLNSTYW